MVNPLLHFRSYWGNFFHVKRLQEALVSTTIFLMFHIYLFTVFLFIRQLLLTEDIMDKGFILTLKGRKICLNL